jgi:hypothetical protein
MKYDEYLDEIEALVKPKYHTIISAMREIDPHDLVAPSSFFTTEYCARGYVWQIFLKKIK